MVFSVEPRGIEPLDPSANHGCLTVRWPLKLHEEIIALFIKKERPRDDSRTLGILIGSVVSVITISN